MKVKVTYISCNAETFSNVEETEIGETFLSLNDEDGDTTCEIALDQILKIEYD